MLKEVCAFLDSTVPLTTVDIYARLIVIGFGALIIYTIAAASSGKTRG